MKLSIAIPAYNAEKTLARTVETVLAQTFRDFELLIVNNGSKDRTGEIAHRLAAHDSRIQVFDVYPNIWGYGARLYAWKRAKGEYITTVDADDFISPNMYETMLAAADRYRLDVVECDYDEVGKSAAGDVDSGDGASALGRIELCETRDEVVEKVVKPTFVDVGRSAYVWNKIYRNRYDFAQWEDGVFGSYEDLIHNLQLFRSVKSYGHLPIAFYHYAPNAASVTRNFSANRIDQFATAIAAKRKLVAAYEISGCDAILAGWVLNDARNAVITAATAGALAVAERAKLVRQIAQMTEVRTALRGCPRHSSRSLILSMARLCPRILVVVLQMVGRVK